MATAFSMQASTGRRKESIITPIGKESISVSSVKSFCKGYLAHKHYFVCVVVDNIIAERIDINGKTAIVYVNEQKIIPKENIVVPQEDEYSDYIIYKVKKGDSLWSISKNYNITIDELIALNNLNNLTITIDQELLVPKVSNKYIVEKGDTLWSIAKNNNLTVEELKDLNNLTNNLISIGQELIIK